MFPPINHYSYYNCLATLHCKKREAVELSTSINGIKRQIDEVLCTLPPYAQFNRHLNVILYVHMLNLDPEITLWK